MIRVFRFHGPDGFRRKPRLVRLVLSGNQFTYKGHRYVIEPEHVIRTKWGRMAFLGDLEGKEIIRAKPSPMAIWRSIIIVFTVFFGAVWVDGLNGSPPGYVGLAAIAFGLLVSIAGYYLGTQYGSDWIKAHGLDPDDPRRPFPVDEGDEEE